MSRARRHELAAGIAVSFLAMGFVAFRLGGIQESPRPTTSPADSGVLIVNRLGDIVGWNPEAERLTGWSRDEVFGQSVDFLIPRNLRAEHRNQMNRAMESMREPVTVACSIRRRDESYLRITVTWRELERGVSYVGFIRRRG